MSFNSEKLLEHADVQILMENFVLLGAGKRFQLQNNSIYNHVSVLIICNKKILFK